MNWINKKIENRINNINLGLNLDLKMIDKRGGTFFWEIILKINISFGD